MYALLIDPHPTALGRQKYYDGSVHRIISDLSAFIGRTDPGTHSILAAGDLNMEFSRANEKSPWLRRERTIIDRMAALCLEMLGPQYPNGRKADTTPERLPPDTRNVPTYRYLKEPLETITWQLDWAFASRGFHQDIIVRALNQVEEWGSSDHCRLLIEIGGG